MMDVTEEQKVTARIILMSKLQELSTDEAVALCHLCLAYMATQDTARLGEYRTAIEALTGPLNLSEWMVLGPVIREVFYVSQPVDVVPEPVVDTLGRSTLSQAIDDLSDDMLRDLNQLFKSTASLNPASALKSLRQIESLLFGLDAHMYATLCIEVDEGMERRFGLVPGY